MGKNNCTVVVSNSMFGDPCRGVLKNLAIQAECVLMVDDKFLTWEK